jgi:DNA-binding response OmpR family regulator
LNQHRILFVDDDAELREIVRQELGANGYAVETAADGEEALTWLKKGSFDLALLDISMPEKSGLDVLSFIKREGLKCRVIMLTGMVGLSSAIESLKLGADDYITKPYNLDYLLTSISRSLKKAGS